VCGDASIAEDDWFECPNDFVIIDSIVVGFCGAEVAISCPYWHFAMMACD
jgi:hypothetical protein|tara:strand:- start:464 stop:613 length:150 start_codon:yes stop_codon:yes gene_type:complete